MATLKQTKAMAFIAEGDSVSKAMTKAGYSPSVAKNPKELTKSVAFIESLEKLGVTDDKLGKVLNEGLEATKLFSSHTEPDKELPDHATRHKFLETGLRLRGHAKDPTPNVIVVPIYGGRDRIKL